MQGECYGCGARLQLSAPDAPGYVTREKYIPKAMHKHTAQLCCARCGALSNGAMVNAVAGQGTETRRGSEGLVTPEQLRAHLAALRQEKALVVMVLDALDFHGTFLRRAQGGGFAAARTRCLGPWLLCSTVGMLSCGASLRWPAADCGTRSAPTLWWWWLPRRTCCRAPPT